MKNYAVALEQTAPVNPVIPFWSVVTVADAVGPDDAESATILEINSVPDDQNVASFTSELAISTSSQQTDFITNPGHFESSNSMSVCMGLCVCKADNTLIPNVLMT